MSQNKLGHILGHVKDLGGDYSEPNTRGYMTNAEMRFHTDACDYVGLLCLQTPMSGGASRIASSVTVYNTMLKRRPELVEALCGDYYRSRSGEVSPGDLPYFAQPIFSFHEGYFSATGVGAVIDKAQQLPGVPKFTPVQKEAVEVYRADRRRDRARHRLPARRHPVPQQFRDAAHAPRISTTGRSRSASATCCGCGSTIRRPADPEGAARGPLRPRRQRQGRAARRAARGGTMAARERERGHRPLRGRRQGRRRHPQPPAKAQRADHGHAARDRARAPARRRRRGDQRDRAARGGAQLLRRLRRRRRRRPRSSRGGTMR